MMSAAIKEVTTAAEDMEGMIVSRPATTAELGDPIAYFARLHEDEGWSYTEIGRECGYDGSVVSKVFGGKYTGDLASVRDAMGDAMRRLLGTSDGAEILTQTAAVIGEALRQSHGSEWMTVIYGPAGIGKTHALRRYVRRCERSRSRRRALLFTLDQQANTRSIMLELANALQISTRGETSVITHAIVETLRKTPHLLIFDEVNNLTFNPRKPVVAAALNTLRQINDLTSCGIVLCGTTSVMRVLQDPRNREMMEMVVSRVGIEMEVFPPIAREMRALLCAHFGEVGDAAWRVFEEGLPSGDASLRRAAVFVRSAKAYMELKKVPEGTALTPAVAKAAWRRIRRG